MINIQRKYLHYTTTNVEKITFAEKNSKIIFINPNRMQYEKVHVDGEEIKVGKRCDYLLTKYDGALMGEYFVELKGSAVTQAIEQLKATIKLLSVDVIGFNNKYAFVVCTKVNPSFNSKIQLAKDKFKCDMGVKLVIKGPIYKHKLY